MLRIFKQTFFQFFFIYCAIAQLSLLVKSYYINCITKYFLHISQMLFCITNDILAFKYSVSILFVPTVHLSYPHLLIYVRDNNKAAQ